jgi:hypothetical protein
MRTSTVDRIEPPGLPLYLIGVALPDFFFECVTMA